MTMKQYNLSEDDLRVNIFKALADNVRLKIIRLLYRENTELSCGEIKNVSVPIRNIVKKNKIEYFFIVY